MKNKIQLTIEHKDHSKVELTNGKGDTFTYNPQKHEGLEDFLNGAKILPSTRNWIPVDFTNMMEYQQASENNCWLKFDKAVSVNMMMIGLLLKPHTIPTHSFHVK